MCVCVGEGEGKICTFMYSRVSVHCFFRYGEPAIWLLKSLLVCAHVFYEWFAVVLYNILSWEFSGMQ